MAQASTGGLAARPALGGHDGTMGGVRIAERVGLGIVSAAVPLGGEEAFAAALNKAYGVAPPAVGRSHAVGGARIAMLQPGQLWIIEDGRADDLLAATRTAFGDAAWLVDQSDAWAALRVSGSRDDIHRALERICILDLATLDENAATRTTMEHLGVILVREQATYTLLSARSSAPSLLHAVAVSARNAND